MLLYASSTRLEGSPLAWPSYQFREYRSSSSWKHRLAVDLISQSSLSFRRGKLAGKVGENWSTVKQDTTFHTHPIHVVLFVNTSSYKLPVKGVNIWDVRIANGPKLALLITVKWRISQTCFLESRPIRIYNTSIRNLHRVRRTDTCKSLLQVQENSSFNDLALWPVTIQN